MNTADIRKSRDRAPFRRFELELTSGTRLPVAHPENLIVGKTAGVVRMPDDFFFVFDTEEVCGIHFPQRRRGSSGRRNSK